MKTNLLLAGDFAKIARITSATLRHYDTIGLLHPILRGDNSYRYYSITQLTEVNLIHVLQESGLSLKQIKKLKEKRTPKHTADTLRSQLKQADRKIKEQIDSRELMSDLLDTILSADDIDEDAITVKSLPEESIVLGNINRYGEGEGGYDALVKFYNYIMKKYPEINVNHPVWGIFTKENIERKLRGTHTWPDRYYFYNAKGRDKRPSGLYAVGYTRGGYGENAHIYTRLKKYIDENGFYICGNTYEEYPLNEICIADKNKYLIRVLVNVKK